MKKRKTQKRKAKPTKRKRRSAKMQATIRMAPDFAELHDQNRSPKNSANGRVEASIIKSDQAALLEEIESQRQKIRDHVMMVGAKSTTGLYVCGPGGTGKTRIIRDTLSKLGFKEYYHTGYLTDIGLFDLLEANRHKVIVMDDLAQTFHKAISLQLLQAALGNQPGRGRIIRGGKAGVVRRIRFTGGIICISNLPLRNDPVVNSTKSRIPCMSFDPSPEHLEAMIIDIARHGWKPDIGDGELTPVQCLEVAEFLVHESADRGCRLDLRTFCDKGLPFFFSWKQHKIRSHWKDMLRDELDNEITTPTIPLGREEKKIQQEILAKNLIERYPVYEDQCREWETRTGTHHRTFSRIKARLKATDDRARSAG